MKVIYYSSVILLMLLTVTSCSQLHPRGLIYSHVTTPLDVNFSKTPAGMNHGDASIKHIHIPYVDLDAIWSSNAIGDIARENGIETVYFADLEKVSFLGLKGTGVWNKYTVHIYGK
ncbi:conserved hypothetical protein [uncultured Desulfobacterium sp.]|uniref:Lipoprotein n=1 Tax=uncultured Desulfobacterium sp. TaxID=201089 RepID=A0A445MWQ4_9BACT|nr:conserved hypothetical protein [uncultured Desulfobacterium sp.]